MSIWCSVFCSAGYHLPVSSCCRHDSTLVSISCPSYLLLDQVARVHRSRLGCSGSLLLVVVALVVFDATWDSQYAALWLLVRCIHCRHAVSFDSCLARPDTLCNIRTWALCILLLPYICTVVCYSCQSGCIPHNFWRVS